MALKLSSYIFALLMFSLVVSLQSIAAPSGRLAVAKISGRVVDAHGHGVAHAVIRLDGAQRTRAVSDTSGHFALASISPGKYMFTVSAAGFKTFTRGGLAVANGAVRLKVQLVSAISKSKSEQDDLSPCACIFP